MDCTFLAVLRNIKSRMFRCALWRVGQAIYERCLIFSIWDVFLIYTPLVCLVFPSLYFFKSRGYFRIWLRHEANYRYTVLFWYLHKEVWSHYTLEKLSHSGIDCFAAHWVNCIIFLFDILNIRICVWLYNDAYMDKKECLLISDLKHKTFHLNYNNCIMRIKGNKTQVCFIPVFKWIWILRVRLEKKELPGERQDTSLCRVITALVVPAMYCVSNTRPVVWKALQWIFTITLQIKHL